MNNTSFFYPVRILLAKIFGIVENNYWTVRYNTYRTRYEIDQSFKFNGEGTKFYGPGRIICGKNSYIGRFSSIQASNNCIVNIGNNVSISHFVLIYTSNIDSKKGLISKSDLPDISGNVTIGDDCWIGAGTFIKEGIEIGPNSFVGAGSVVTHSLPSGIIAGGVPARIIRNRDIS